MEHNQYGWFQEKPRSYAKLLEYESVQLFAQSYPETSREGNLYALEFFFNINNVSPDEVLQLSDSDVRKALRKAVFDKHKDGSYGSAKRIYYVVKRFMELHDRELRFKPAQRRLLLKTKPKKISKQYVPNKEDIYRMVDSIPKKDEVQQTRARAIILSLWQSGVRGSCLCSWKYGMFREKLWPDVEVPLPIKVVSNRPKGVNDVAQDTKLSGYKVDYYYTFLHKEAVLALKAYLEARKKRGWIPKDSDYVFVTSGTISRGKRINSKHLNALFKTACSQIGIDPESVWTHVLRKSFRKTLYKGGVDIDIAEALMGHKLAGSRTSYFDYADLDFIKEQYLSANWDRFPIKQLEETVVKLEENGKNKDEQIKELQKQIDYLKSPEYVKSVLQGIISRGKPLEVKPVRKPQIRKIRHDAIDEFIKLRKEGFNIERENSEWIVMIKEED